MNSYGAVQWKADTLRCSAVGVNSNSQPPPAGRARPSGRVTIASKPRRYPSTAARGSRHLPLLSFFGSSPTTRCAHYLALLLLPTSGQSTSFPPFRPSSSSSSANSNVLKESTATSPLPHLGIHILRGSWKDISYDADDEEEKQGKPLPLLRSRLSIHTTRSSSISVANTHYNAAGVDRQGGDRQGGGRQGGDRQGYSLVNVCHLSRSLAIARSRSIPTHCGLLLSSVPCTSSSSSFSWSSSTSLSALVIKSALPLELFCTCDGCLPGLESRGAAGGDGRPSTAARRRRRRGLSRASVTRPRPLPRLRSKETRGGGGGGGGTVVSSARGTSPDRPSGGISKKKRTRIIACVISSLVEVVGGGSGRLGAFPRRRRREGDDRMNCCALPSLRSSHSWGEGRRQREGPPAPPPFGSIAAGELGFSFVSNSSVTWTSKKKRRRGGSASASSSTIPSAFVGNPLGPGVCRLSSSFSSSTSIGLGGFGIISGKRFSRGRASRGKGSSSGVVGRGDSSSNSRRILTKAMADVDAVASAAETKAIAPKGRAPRVMLVSDLDNTMVDHADKSEIGLLRFNALWTAEYSQDSVLVYSTGRSKKKYEELRAETPLMTPDITILSVGTVIIYGESMVHDADWERVLDQGWDRDIVAEETKKFPDLRAQEGSEQGRHKLSFYVGKHVAKHVIEELSRRLEARQVRAKLIYSGGIDLDVLPVGAGKGQALAYVLEKMKAKGCPPGKTLVCGDSGNDAELFEVKGVKGVVVGNAKEELLDWYHNHATADVFKATKHCAAGIIEAMQHFGFEPATSPRDVSSSHNVELSSSRMRAIVDANLFLERWWRGEVPREADLLEHGFTGKLSPDAHIILHDGTEIGPGAEKARDYYLSTHGKFKGSDYRRWFDRVSEVEVAPGVWIIKLVQWDAPDHKWRGVKMTVGLRANEGRPNGLDILFLHSTAV